MMLKLILLSLCVFDFVCCLPEPEAGLDASYVHTLSRVKRGGACTTTADCVSGNVCSKWGWCQWTSQYGSDGPSQGASAPGGGVAGQCVTSADCASRVPYCSKLGFCHGGRLPFDEAQLEIDEADKEEKDDQPQGFINNNPRKNNPILRKSAGSKSGNSNRSNTKNKNGNKRPSSNSNRKPSSNSNRRSGGNSNKRPSGNGNRRNGGNKNNTNARKSSSNGRKSNSTSRKQNGSGSKSGACPGGNLDSCIDACIPIKKVAAYGACVTVCGNRCK